MKFLEGRAIETWHFDAEDLGSIRISDLKDDLLEIGMPMAEINTMNGTFSVWLEDDEAREEDLEKVLAKNGVKARLRSKNRETGREVAKRLAIQFFLQTVLAAFLLYALRTILIFVFHELRKFFPGITEGSGLAWFWSLQALAVMWNFRYRSDPLYILAWLCGIALSFVSGPHNL